MNVSLQRWLFVVAYLAIAVILVTLLNLGAWAAKGPRYTADDGNRDRQERIAMDLALAARIDQLHALLEDKCRL